MKERRQHCRVSGDMVRDIFVRVRAGGDGTLVNFNRYGVLVAVRRPIPPGRWIDMQLSDGEACTSVRALVLRCSVREIAALEGVTYEAALRFDREADLPCADRSHNGYSVHAISGTNSSDSGSLLPATTAPVTSSSVESLK